MVKISSHFDDFLKLYQRFSCWSKVKNLVLEKNSFKSFVYKNLYNFGTKQANKAKKS